MAYDLLLGKTGRFWAMPDRLVITPAPAPAKTVDPTREIFAQIKRAAPGLKVEKRDRGAVVSKKWKWG